jgi:hypothetical protein
MQQQLLTEEAVIALFLSPIGGIKFCKYGSVKASCCLGTSEATSTMMTPKKRAVGTKSGCQGTSSTNGTPSHQQGFIFVSQASKSMITPDQAELAATHLPHELVDGGGLV